MNKLFAIVQPVVESSSDMMFLVGIQLFLLFIFVIMLTVLCKVLKKKDPEKSTKKACILIWFMSAIAWFIIAQIVWILTYSQITGI